MPPLGFQLDATLRRLATRNPGRSEADIQADVRDVLLYGGFDLDEEHVLLEQATADRGRLDVSIGNLIIECKRSVQSPSSVATGSAQLAAYLVSDGRGRNGVY